MSRLITFTFFIVSLVAIVAIGAPIFLNSFVKKQSLPVFWSVPDFQLVSDEGQMLSLEDLKGKIWVAYFFFTSCGTICPVMNSNMTEVQKTFKSNPDVVIVGFTVDPETDTPEVLNEFRKNFNAMKGKWIFVTGDKKSIYRLARHGFKVPTEEVKPEEEGGPTDFIHSNKFILVDRQGRIRGFYDGTDEKSVKKLIADTKKLLWE